MSANPQKLGESVRPVLPDRLRRNQPCSHLASGIPASRAKTIHFHCLNHSVCGTTGSLRGKKNAWIKPLSVMLASVVSGSPTQMMKGTSRHLLPRTLVGEFPWGWPCMSHVTE